MAYRKSGDGQSWMVACPLRSSLSDLSDMEEVLYDPKILPVEVTYVLLPTRSGEWRLRLKPRHRWQLRRWLKAWARWWARTGHKLAASPEMWVE
jgi:hypothetical protein